MKGSSLAIWLGIGVLFLGLALFGAFGWRGSARLMEERSATTSVFSIPGHELVLTTTSGIESWYTNETLKFSFRLPDGFLAPEADPGAPGAHAVVVHDDADHRLTVVALPVKGITTLTEEDIKANMPGAIIMSVREGYIGTLVRGLYFSAQTGADREQTAFWFLYDGYVYELSTATEDAVLLDFIVSTWRFAPPTPSPRR